MVWNCSTVDPMYFGTSTTPPAAIGVVVTVAVTVGVGEGVGVGVGVAVGVTVGGGVGVGVGVEVGLGAAVADGVPAVGVGVGVGPAGPEDIAATIAPTRIKPKPSTKSAKALRLSEMMNPTRASRIAPAISAARPRRIRIAACID